MRGFFRGLFTFYAVIVFLGATYAAVNAMISAQNIIQQIYGTTNACAALLAAIVILLCEGWIGAEERK